MSREIHLHVYQPPPDAIPLNPAAVAEAVEPPALALFAGTLRPDPVADPPKAARAPLRDWLRGKLLDAARDAGRDPAEAAAMLDRMAAERPLIDWLAAGGWKKLLELFLELLAAG